MKKLLILIAFAAILTVTCSSGSTEGIAVPDSFFSKPVSSQEIINLVCGTQTECLSNICADAEKCPLSIALSNETIFDFINTYSECEGCNTQEFSPDQGIGKCIEYEIFDRLADWQVKFWVSEKCEFRYGSPSQNSISVKINTETLRIESITPAVEYIVDPSYCEIDTDCKCLPGFGVRCMRCANFLYAPLHGLGYFPGFECECEANQCVKN